MYNIPARTGTSLAPITVGKLARNYKNIIGVKDSSGNLITYYNILMKQKDTSFSVLSGNGRLILWTLLAGGKGGITAIANILPTVMVSIYQNYLKGDMEAAKRHSLLSLLLENMF